MCYALLIFGHYKHYLWNRFRYRQILQIIGSLLKFEIVNLFTLN